MHGTRREGDARREGATYHGGVFLLLASILGIGIFLGWGFGGSLRNLGSVHIRLWPVALVALALQAIPLPSAEEGGLNVPALGIVLLSYALLLLVVAMNWRLRGFLVMGLGFLLNAVVITANQGMPVSEGALRRVGREEAAVRLQNSQDPRHHLAGSDDVLLPLADVIPLGDPYEVVVSVGDAAAYAGAAWFLAAAMLGRPARRVPPDPPRSARATTSGIRP